MSLTDIAVLLQDTVPAIRTTEAILAENPDDFATITNLQSLRNRQETLRAEFDAVAATQQVDLLDYRMVLEGGGQPVRAVNAVLETFQRAFAVILDSISSHPKKRARISEAAVKASDFGFAFSYAGSLGFVLTAPREISLLETNRDQAMSAIAEGCVHGRV